MLVLLVRGRDLARPSMSGPAVILASDWERMARQQVETARVLALALQWGDAFYHSGFAVECALKLRIMRFERLNSWPDRTDRRELYVHDLSKLARVAGIEAVLLAEINAQSDIGLAWMVAQDWSVEVRYDPRPFPAQRGADMVEAVAAKGLLEWLMQS